MSKIDNQVAFKEAELDLLKAEDVFIEKKEAGEATTEDKLALRQLRQDFRLNHRRPAAEGAQPGSIGVGAEVKEV